MIINKFEDWMTKEVKYNISIEAFEDIEPQELAECFKLQYPNTKCVISFMKITQMSGGMIIIGLKLKKQEKQA